MKHILEPLRVNSLTNFEADELISRHQSDIATFSATLITDTVLNAYLAGLNSKFLVYTKTLMQIQETADTRKIEAADTVRDLAIVALDKAIKLASVSDITTELDAARILTVLLKPYKRLATLNYESETIGIDNLIANLESTFFSKHITTLNLGRYVTRLKTANTTFKTLFGGRIVGSAASEHFKTKLVRADLFAHYKEFTYYVQAMANATNSDQFVKTLNILNVARKYYTDQIERRNGKKLDNYQANTSITAEQN